MFGVLLASYAINAMDRQLFPLLAPEVRRQYGFSLAGVGFLSTVFTLGMAIAGLPDTNGCLWVSRLLGDCCDRDQHGSVVHRERDCHQRASRSQRSVDARQQKYDAFDVDEPDRRPCHLRLSGNVLDIPPRRSKIFADDRRNRDELLWTGSACFDRRRMGRRSLLSTARAEHYVLLCRCTWLLALPRIGSLRAPSNSVFPLGSDCQRGDLRQSGWLSRQSAAEQLGQPCLWHLRDQSLRIRRCRWLSGGLDCHPRWVDDGRRNPDFASFCCCRRPRSGTAARSHVLVGVLP